MNSRDSSILRHMVGYCQQIQKSVERFGDSFEVFQADPDYKNSVALCVLQIGELSGQLSEEFKDTHREIPWREIKAMRNVVPTVMAPLIPRCCSRRCRMISQPCWNTAKHCYRHNESITFLKRDANRRPFSRFRNHQTGLPSRFSLGKHSAWISTRPRRGGPRNPLWRKELP